MWRRGKRRDEQDAGAEGQVQVLILDDGGEGRQVQLVLLDDGGVHLTAWPEQKEESMTLSLKNFF